MYNSQYFSWVVRVYRLLPPSSEECRGCTGREGIIVSRADLADLVLEPVVVAVGRVLVMAVQARDPVRVRIMVEYIRALVT